MMMMGIRMAVIQTTHKLTENNTASWNFLIIGSLAPITSGNGITINAISVKLPHPLSAFVFPGDKGQTYS
jgi:hypothetical protein